MREPAPSQLETANDAAASMPVLPRHHVVASASASLLFSFFQQSHHQRLNRRDLASAISLNVPKLHIVVILNPVNSAVPIGARTLEKAGTYDPTRLFGITTLDVVRASRFLSGIAGADPA
ncbi:hypothetical protein M422DRAFT_271735 [Sphaerobolus stellatus SS14]|uniref:Malate dehydrogenase n=1 Tax=Sphaerobolus stellatus (strain SS14) TaxID=990650 RepID=A0A0C9TD36_SPHS4|nr:hypothetical protein M422DRAFT_271735 [Sphaerobolus stellatus SS14]